MQVSPVSPVPPVRIVSDYVRQLNVGDKIHNIVVTHKDFGGSVRVEEVYRTYDKTGKIRTVEPVSKVDVEV